jgi:hypothetical protein
MPINNVTSDYTGRKKDISILQNPDPLMVGAQSVTPAFGSVGRFVAGVQKTIQRYAIILLTNINSQKHYPEFGTGFLSELSKYSAVDALQARQLFVMASFSAVSLMQNYQSSHPEIPLDERIVSASLIDIVVNQQGVYFSISIKTEAGSILDFLLPLPK